MSRCAARWLPIACLWSSAAIGQVITVVAGGGWKAFPTPVAAVVAPLGGPRSPVFDGQGNLYVADSYNHIVVRISGDGTLMVVAGNGNPGSSGDGGSATAASLNSPTGIAVDSASNLYIADTGNQRIRKVSGGVITTVAGTGKAGFSGDGGLATAATLSQPSDVAVDTAGNLYISDGNNNRIREVSNGIITTVAGGGAGPALGDGGPATSALLSIPRGIAVDSAGNLYIAEDGNSRVRKVTGGIISTVVGRGVAGFSGDGGPATSASIDEPIGVTVDSSGNLFIADEGNNRVRKVTGGIINTVAGSSTLGFSGDGGPVAAALMNGPNAVAVDSSGNLFIADYFNGRIRKVSGGIINTTAGTGGGTFFGDGGPATSAALLNTYDVAVDSNGNLYIADGGNDRVRKVSGGIINTAAGSGVTGFSGDGGPAANALLDEPRGVATDSAGNLYFADLENHRVRKVSGGTITTVAGNGVSGFSGDNGPATQAELSTPVGVAVDASGSLYIADTDNHRIRKVSGGTITTVAGTGTGSFSGDNGPATSATLDDPQGVALDAAGNLYIADTGNNRIRKISGGTIITVAGNGTEGFSGDMGPALSAALDKPSGVAVDTSGNLFIADDGNNRIRKVSGGNIATFAGNGAIGNSGNGGLAVNAALNGPSGVAVDSAGNVYIAEINNYRVLEVLKNPPSYQVAPLTLTFSASAGGSAPDSQTIGLSSTVPGLGFTTSTSATWLSVTPSSGSMPASLQVGVDPTSLAAGTFQGTITISAPNAALPTATVAVALAVQSVAPPQLSVGAQNLSFTAPQASVAQSTQVQISNAGGGSLSFTAVANTASGGGWLSVSPASGAATAALPASLTVTATPGLLMPGTYTGVVSIKGAGTTTSVAVTLSVSLPNASILLSQSGLSFAAVEQGGAPLSQTFGVLNTGQGSMNWTATANTLSGGNWLTISPSSGTVVQPNLDVSTVSVSIDPTGLTAGAYYAQIQVSSLAVNSPQLLTVILTVLPAGTTPGPEVQPNGLIFTGVAGVSPGSQDVLLGNPKAQTDSYLSAYIGNGFTYLPTAADVPTNQPTTLRVFPDFSQLQPGEIARGTIALQFADGTPRTISILTVVAPSAAMSSSRVGPLASAGCTKTNLEVEWRSPMQNFGAIVGQPTTIEVQVVDDCGNLIGPSNPKGASVTATFTNKDSLITLTHIGNGVWTGTWRPVNPSPTLVVVTVTAFNSVGTSLQSGQQSLPGNLSTGVTPLVTANGVVHAASDAAGVPIAPGGLITLYGSNLSDATGLSSTLPLPQQQNGTQVLLGNLPLPILYTSNGQINVQVPFETPVNTQYQISVQRDNVLSVPQQLVVAAAQPGVFTVNEQGSGQGVIFRSDGVTLADTDSPAAEGETVVMYCTGLGAVTPAVPEGTPPPASPLSNTVSPVTVTIGGENAAVSFNGLTPGFPGLYQINAVVPIGVSGDAVPVVVSVAGQTSPPVTMAVQ